MKRVTMYSAAALLVAALVALAGPVRGQDDMSRTNSGTPSYGSPGSSSSSSSDVNSNQREQRVRGTISVLDASGQSITVKGLLIPKTFKTSTETMIEGVAGKTKPMISDLAVGDKVEVRYHTQDNVLIADQITVLNEKGESNRSNSGWGTGSSSSQPGSSSPGQSGTSGSENRTPGQY